MDGWKEKHKWHKNGKGFLVEVSHHTIEISDELRYDNEGPNRWCIYAYIYPNHHLFSTFEVDNLFQDSISSLPLHGGCTYLRHHLDMDDSVYVTAIQIGCDYNHIYDTDYTMTEVHGDDWRKKEIFEDAERLFEYLEGK